MLFCSVRGSAIHMENIRTNKKARIAIIVVLLIIAIILYLW